MSQRFISVEITSSTPAGKKFDGIYADSEYKTRLTTSTEYDYVAESGTLKTLFIKYSNLPVNLLFTPHSDVDYKVNGSFGSVLVSRGNITNQLISVPDSDNSTTFRIDSIELVNAPQFAGYIPSIQVDGSSKELPFASSTIVAGTQVNIELVLNDSITTSTLPPPPPQGEGTLRFEYRGSNLPLTLQYSDMNGSKTKFITQGIQYFPVVGPLDREINYVIQSIHDSLGNELNYAEISNYGSSSTQGIPFEGNMYHGQEISLIIGDGIGEDTTSTSTLPPPPMPILQEANLEFSGEGNIEVDLDEGSQGFRTLHLTLPATVGLSRTINSDEAAYNTKFEYRIAGIRVDGSEVERVSVFTNGMLNEEFVPFNSTVDVNSYAKITISTPTTSTSTEPPYESTLVLNTNAPSTTVEVSTENGIVGSYTLNNGISSQIQID